VVERTIDAVGVRSAAEVFGVVGLLLGIVVGLTWLVVGGPGGGRAGFPELLFAVTAGVLYGVVGGAVSAVVYNAAASLVGGLELELS